MITTRNRLLELQRTLSIIEKLSPPADEIMITADGCQDGTVEFVQENYPNALLTINEGSLGSVVSRVRMMQRTTADFVLALDDDSYPENLDCIAGLLQVFAANPKLAVASLPQRTDEYPETLNQASFGDDRPCRSFACSAACLRVETYRLLPGFEALFFHMYEEPDYALQCIGYGWEVRVCPDLIVRHHFSSEARNEIRNHHRHARNELWSTLMRCPMPFAVAMIGYRVLSQAKYAASRGRPWLLREPLWWWQALVGIRRALSRRQPVSWQGYKRWLKTPTA